MSSRTLADLEPVVIDWAAKKGLIKYTVGQSLAQHSKTVEEVDELLKANASGDKNEIRLEAGDVLVTLIIQSAIQKFSFANAVLPIRYDLRQDPIDLECQYLGTPIIGGVRPAVRFSMQRMTSALVDIVRPHGLTLSECLEAAFDKIRDRKGKTIDGVFVKQADLDIQPSKAEG